MRLLFLRAVLTLAVVIVPAAARAAIIDFDSALDFNFQSPDVYTEDGFTFAAISGSQWALVNDRGNPPSALEAGSTGPLTTGDTISVTLAGGGLFTFGTFDAATFSAFTSGKVNFIGLVNGLQTQALLGVFSSSTTFATLSSLFSSPINELRIVAADQTGAATGLELDNLVLTPAPVPEPASLSLLGLGLAALGARRWRQRHQS